jgi:hypothetical protein
LCGGVGADDIVSVTVERSRPQSETLHFQREDKDSNWKMTRPHDSHVDDSAVSSLVRQALDARQDKMKPGVSLKDAGLEPPAAVVTLQSKDGREWKINLGNQVTAGQSGIVYATSSDQSSSVAAVQYARLDTPFKPIPDFRSKDLLAPYPIEIKSVILRDGKDVVDLRETGPSEWRFDQPKYGATDYNGTDLPADAKPPRGVSALLEAIAGLKVAYKSDKDNDFVADDVSDLAKYGLEPGVTNRLSIDVGWTPTGKTTNKSDKLLIGKPVDDKGKMVYARLDSEKNVVKLPADSLTIFRNVLEDDKVRQNLRDRVLVRFDPKKIDAIELQGADGKSFRLLRVENKIGFGPENWKLIREGSPTQNADSGAVTALLDALRPTNLQTQKEKGLIEEFLPSDTKFDKPLETVTLWEDAVEKETPKKDEKKDDKKDGKKDDKKEEKKDAEPKLKPNAKPLYKLTFFLDPTLKKAIGVKREKGDQVLVAAVSDSLQQTLTAGVQVYRDRTLPSLEGEITKVVIDRGSDDVWELKNASDKKEFKQTWKIVRPEKRADLTADPNAVGAIIRDLNPLHADKLLEEKPTADLEKKYGLDKPRAKVILTVKKDDKPEDYTYVFGGDAPDGGVYLKVSKLDELITVGKHVLTDVQADLRDKTIFPFTTTKVKGMKLEGGFEDFGAALGHAYILDLEHNGPQDWKVKETSTNKNFKVDVSRTEQFLTSLIGMQVKQFLPKTTEKPEHKLRIEDNALKIELRVDGEKDPSTLTVGGLTNDKDGYYATSSRLPGEVFVVPNHLFDKVKQKTAGESNTGMPGYFATK